MSGIAESSHEMRWGSNRKVYLPEVCSPDEFAANLDLILKSKIPGFIIRHGVAYDALNVTNNRSLGEKLLEELRAMGHEFVAGDHLLAAQRESKRRKGELQVGMDGRKAVDTINGHTTVLGTGAVLLANSGPKAIKALSKIKSNPKLIKPLEERFAIGDVDWRIIEPKLYAKLLKRGDHLVFPDANEHGPIWRRFDTADAPRRASIFILHRVVEKNAQ